MGTDHVYWKKLSIVSPELSIPLWAFYNALLSNQIRCTCSARAPNQGDYHKEENNKEDVIQY